MIEFLTKELRIAKYEKKNHFSESKIYFLIRCKFRAVILKIILVKNSDRIVPWVVAHFRALVQRFASH